MTDFDFWSHTLPRRRFLKYMAASMALAGLKACTRQPLEKIVPYTEPPERLIPGKPLYYASALTLGGVARGVLVESHMGRPTKVEGNPHHPDSLGATDAFMQAAILELYDPDRSQTVLEEGQISTWDQFVFMMRKEKERFSATRGAGLRVLTETVTSPTLQAQLQSLLRQFPDAQWHSYEPVARDSLREGARLAFARNVETVYRVDRADVIVSLDSDFLMMEPGSLNHARQFSRRRRPKGDSARLNRLYVVEPMPTVTGSMADHRWAMKRSEGARFASGLAIELGLQKPPGGYLPDNRVTAIARDLKSHRGRCLMMAGLSQPASVHAVVHALNESLGNVGSTLYYTEPLNPHPQSALESLRTLTEDIERNAVQTLLIIGGNPVFTAPADARFKDLLQRVPKRIHLGLFENETSEICHWHVPAAHELETWGDARAYDGTVTILQPLIAPLYGGRSPLEFLSSFVDPTARSAHDIVKEHWKQISNRIDFETFWQETLHDGVLGKSASPEFNLRVRKEFLEALNSASRIEDLAPSLKDVILSPPEGGRRISPLPLQTERRDPSSAFRPPQDDTNRKGTSAEKNTSLELNFSPDPTVWDGRFANNGWLQELPKPITKLTWDNAAFISPATAERLGLGAGDRIELSIDHHSVAAPVWVVQGHADDAVTIHLGYGRLKAGRLGSKLGFNAYQIRLSHQFWNAANLAIKKLKGTYAFACTQGHFQMEGRDLVRHADVATYEDHPDFAQKMKKEPSPDDSIYTIPATPQSEQYAWGMAIDLNACIGCGACTMACQAENNIPIVGKEQVIRQREMHWIRVDHYFEGPAEEPAIFHQPVPCMHCETAPCEVVCPVAATTHSDEGLNEMTYNRCVGTRYCSNNCPYKVRRFNFLQYTDRKTEIAKFQRNPDVTVRDRGVMEKCTYCVQRISQARISAEKENRSIQEGEVVTACQQACPTEAIIFGNIKDASSAVAQMKKDPRNYGILTELNTRPRTTYLARLRNPNKELI